MKREYQELITKLKAEGSYESYVEYLKRSYGVQQAGSWYSQQLDACNISDYPIAMDAFLEYALEQDLAHKSLEKLDWIAEAEKQFSNKPYYTALDRYFRINPNTHATKEEVQEAVRQLESFHSGEGSFYH